MKISPSSLRREKRVYYYKHQHGVLANKKRSIVRTASSLLVATALIGGVSALSLQILDQTTQPQKPAVQRQAAALNTAQKDGEQDKLKSVEKKATEDEQLAKQIRTKLKNVPGAQKWSVYVRDVKSERMANVNSDTVLEAGNLSSVLMALPLEAKRPSNTWGYSVGKMTLAQCVQNTLNSGDPACKQVVNRYADVANANNVLSTQGLKKTTVTAKEQKTTARDMGELLYRLQSGQGLSDKARRAVFDGLYTQKQREGIPAGCDQTCLVANITGEGNNIRHDAAIVTAGSAQYVVVIMTNGGSWAQIADVAASIRTELQP